jgi:hypothetical protein
MKRIVIVSDLQIPFHDRVAVKNVAQFITKFKPHEVVTIGDEIDFNTISKWSEGTPEAYEQTLGDDRDEAVQVLYDLQVTQMIRSNHTDRLYNQIMRKIPSFLSLPELRFEKFMRLDELGIPFTRSHITSRRAGLQSMATIPLSSHKGVSQPLRQPVGTGKALSRGIPIGQGDRPSQRPQEAV